MSDMYVPTTDEVRDSYRHPHYGLGESEMYRRFDAWLVQHDRAVREQAAQEIEAHVGITPIHDGGLVLAAQFVREGGQ